jgi:hypothetical protein
LDLLVEYNTVKYVIEIKLIYEKQSPDTIKTRGLEQITKYRDTTAANAPAYLVIFDRRPETKEESWDQRLSWEIQNGITVIGC